MLVGTQPITRSVATQPPSRISAQLAAKSCTLRPPIRSAVALDVTISAAVASEPSTTAWCSSPLASGQTVPASSAAATPNISVALTGSNRRSERRRSVSPRKLRVNSAAKASARDRKKLCATGSKAWACGQTNSRPSPLPDSMAVPMQTENSA